MKKDVCNVAIAGCGVVGGAVAKHLLEKSDLLQKRTGQEIRLKYILSKTFNNAKELGLDSSLFVKDIDKIISDPEIDIVVELIGGIDIPKDIIERSLKAGKHVVTANKALLAEHGTGLWALARKLGKTIAFEASCGGGIPLVRALYDGLISNEIEAIYGILNGTCNYILTEMISEGKTYAEALADAQELGFAEADPYLDVSGGDTAHKLAILSSLAFGTKVDFDKITVQGIDSLDLIDVSIGADLGYVVKLLAVAHRQKNGISLRVRPAFISSDHPLSWIPGPFNAVSIYGRQVGHTLSYGRGAGGGPTASAVITDINSIALGSYQLVFDTLGIWPDKSDSLEIIPVQEIESRYYLRIMVKDQPGVFGNIAGLLADQQISIASALQHEAPEDIGDDEVVPIIITTHKTKELSISAFLEKVQALNGVTDKPVCINIVDEHPEGL